ncbi:MAG: hypothetical protein KIH63_004230 [Candidatus Saccharibacteria bacterium]|nr:hypothetical protein [Candidatus Saccharibacteria bacterium]
MKFKRSFREYFQIMVLLAASILPMVFPSGTASAADLTDRKATISTSKPSSTDVEFIFSYNIPNTTNTKGGIIYQFCTTPLGTCTASGWTLTGFTHDSQASWPNNGTAFAAHAATNENDCSQSTNATTMICFERDETVATGTTGGAVTHTISGINTNSTIQTVYIRISLYSDDDFQTADLLDSGVVAVAIVRQLTVSGRVQERLNFCVFAIDDAAALPTNCAAAPTTTSIDIGIVDSSAIATSPVDNNPPTSQGNDFYGALQVNTNAQDGITVTYFPETASTGTNELRSFRVPGASCDVSGTSTTDPCFVDASGSGETFTAGTERFGMYIPCIDTTQGTTTNLGSVAGAYDGSDNSVTSGADCENEAATDFAWSDSTTAATLASSSNVVDDEIIKVRFAATASATTPTGSYTVVTTYIATPQF